MIAIAWDQYKALYPSDTEEDFDRLLPDAEMRMDSLTANRWRQVEDGDWRASRVRRCLAAVLHMSIDAENNPAISGVTSISNDGYSESYARKTAYDAEEEIRRLGSLWLSCTGLVSAL